ncbi:unnamed protein product [Dicrocoelium dendriticum]|nr:unnamed protein product [Dicrocoelium dendriticum]
MAMNPPRDPILELVPPHPVIHRRNRTQSQSERAANAESGKGVIVSFCREKGHGYIKPDDGGDYLFVHVFDIDGEVIPNQGDLVEYKKMLLPPKNEKYQAVHVKLINLAPGKHKTWDDPPEVHVSM